MAPTAVGAAFRSRPMVGRATFTMVVSRALMKIVAVKTTATAAFSLTWTRTALPQPRIPQDSDSEDTHYYAGDVKPRTGKDAVDAVIYAAHRIRTATDA